MHLVTWIHRPYLLACPPITHNLEDQRRVLQFLAYLRRIRQPSSLVYQYIRYQYEEALSNSYFTAAFIAKVKRIAAHPFFRRAWVLQEVHSNERVTLRLCNVDFPWDVFRCLLQVTIEAHWSKYTTWDDSRAPKQSGAFEGHEEFQWDVSVPSLWLHVGRRVNGERHNIPLAMILRKSGSFRSTDPRDRLYAFYHLSLDVSTGSFTPNYSVSVSDTYRIFTEWCLHSMGSLQILSFTNPPRSSNSLRSTELPSWVPDFTSFDDLSAELLDFRIGFNATFRANAGRVIRQCRSSDSRVLCLAGYAVKRVKYAISPTLLGSQFRKEPDSNWSDYDLDQIFRFIPHAPERPTVAHRPKA
jgi:hypothetical protein